MRKLENCGSSLFFPLIIYVTREMKNISFIIKSKSVLRYSYMQDKWIYNYRVMGMEFQYRDIELIQCDH